MCALGVSGVGAWVGVGWLSWCGVVGGCVGVFLWWTGVLGVPGVFCACLLFWVWCARRVLRVLAFVVGRVACTFFGSVLAGCVSGGVFGVCGFRSPARAPCLGVG